MNLPLALITVPLTAAFLAHAGTLATRAESLLASHSELVFCTRPLCQCHLMYGTFGEYADEETSIYPKGGSSVCLLNLKTHEVKKLLDDPAGSFRDLRVSYDATKLLFAWRKAGSVYHLYEMNADGSAIHPLTDGPDDDFDGCYLPDGGIIFASGRCHRFIPCNRVRTANLYRMDGDGKNILPLSSNVLLEDRPAVLPDGRVIYTRWDYLDRATETFRDLWVMNPDGTSQMVLFGGFPRPYPKFFAKCDAMPVPNNKREVVCTFSPGFGYRENAGKVMLVDLRKGPDNLTAEKMISPDISQKLGWEVGNGGERCRIGFRDPFPLAEDCYLVCTNKSILLMDDKGNLETVYTANEMVHDPRPLLPRPREPVLASKIDLSKDTGVFVLADVYASRNMEGVKRGTVKKLLVMEDLPKSASRHGWRGEHGGHISLHRVLGEVPVEEDGSACFEAPCLRALFFAALDERGIAVKRMQNFTQVMPGETQGCVGCHERRTQDIAKSTGDTLLALRRKPSTIAPVPGVPGVYRYLRDVQPVWDAHCVSCHSADKAAGHTILTAEKTEWHTMSYDMLYAHDQISRASGWGENGDHGPYGFGTGASPLMKKIDGSHHGVKVSQAEWDLVRCWIESSGHFTGTYATHNHFEAQVGAAIPTAHDAYNPNIGDSGKRVAFNSFTKPALAEPMESIAKRRCYSCHENVYGLGRLRREQRDHKFVNGKPPEWLNNPNYSLTLFDITVPDHSLFLRAPLSQAQGGYAWCKGKDGKPVEIFKDKTDPDYQAVVKAIDEAKARQTALGRTEDPGYKPMPYYVRWMKRFGILPKSFDLGKATLDIYATDEAYWKSLWYTKPLKQCDGHK